MFAKKSSKDLTKNQLLDGFLAQINDRYHYQPVAVFPDIEALRRVIAGGETASKGDAGDSMSQPIRAAMGRLEKKNSLDSSYKKSIRHFTPPSFEYCSSTESGKNFYIKNSGYDYRKDDPPLYSKASQESEDAILKKLDKLLQENEISGLDENKEKEMQKLYKKLR